MGLNRLIALVVTALLAMTVGLVLLLLHSHQANAPTQGNLFGYDRIDPYQSGCANDKATAPGSRSTTLVDATGNVVGDAVLYESPTCRTVWVELQGFTNPKHASVHIDLTRLSDGATAPFLSGGSPRTLWGPMLQLGRSCVMASIHFDEAAGVTLETCA